MANREKVIKGLECCASNRMRREDCEAMDCAYLDLEEKGCIHQLIRDALALLKAQEPKPPIITENAYGWKFYHCPSCGREFYGDRLHGRMNKTAFCDKCGQAVKWG